MIWFRAFRTRWLIPCALWLLATVPVIGSPVLADDVQQEYQLAAGMYQREQWDEASAAFERIILDFPESDEAALAHFFVGESLVQQARYEQAFDAFDTFLANLPEHEFAARATFRMGEAAFKSGKQRQAVGLLEKYLRDGTDQPLAAFALSCLGEIRLNRNEPQLAERVFEEALKANPAGPIANHCRFGLARSLHLQDRIADARRFYQFILAEPDNPLAPAACLQLGMIGFADRQFDEAESQLQQVVDATGVSARTRAEARYWLARTAIARNQPDVALEHFTAMDGDVIEPNLRAAAWFDGAIVAWQKEHADLAIDWLTRLLQQSPQHDLADDARAMKIRILSQSGREVELDQEIDRFVVDHSDSSLLAEVLEARGRRAYERDNFSLAIETFSDLLTSSRFAEQQDHPNTTATWTYFQSLAHLGLKEFRNAESLLVSIDQEVLSGNLPPLVEIALAKSRFAQKKYGESIPSYRRYLELSADDEAIQKARYELTLALAHNRQWTDAVKQFLQWADFENAAIDDSAVADTARFLVSLANKHQQTDAVQQLYHWMAQDHQPAEVASHGLAGLAWIQLDQNDQSTAMATFAELLKRFPDSEHAEVAGMATANWHESQQQWHAAADAYEQVCARFADSDSGHLALLRRGFALQKLSGEDNLQQARSLILRWLGHAKTLTAVKDSQRLVQAEALYQLAWICRDLGDDQQANESFAELYKQFPDSKYWPDAAFRLASRDLENDRFEAALQILDQLIESDDVPGNILSRGLFQRGNCLAKIGRWSEAVDVFEDLLTRPLSEALLDKSIYWLAESHYQLGQYLRSGEQFEKLHGDPNRQIDEALRPWIALRLAQCHANSEKWSDAEDIATVARQRYADFKLAYEFDYLIARGLEDAGQLKAAIERYQRVVDSADGGHSETAAMSQWRIGEVYFHQEDFVGAIKAYYRVDSLYAYAHWRAAALLQAGKCQEHLQNWKHAQKLYLQLLEQFPDSEFAADAETRLENAQTVTTRATSDRSTRKPPTALSR